MKCAQSVYHIIIEGMSSKQAIHQIETLQRDLEKLTIISRDVCRIQMELQFMKMDIKESQNTWKLDSRMYNILANKAARALEEHLKLLLESSAPSEPLILVEQIKELDSDLNKVIEQVEQQQDENVSDLIFIYPLCDLLNKQLEQVQRTIEQTIFFL